MNKTTRAEKSVGAVELKADGTVRAVIGTANRVDFDGDILLPGAIPDGSEAVISAWNHSSTGERPPVGKGTIHNVGDRVVFKGVFFDTPRAQEVRTILAALGPRAEWSWAYDVERSKPERINGRQVRLLQKVRVFEVSPVLRAASIGTETLEVHGRDLTDEQHAELLAIRSKSEAWRLQQEGQRIQARAERDRALAMLAEAAKPDGARMAAARKFAEAASRALGLQVPDVKWFSPGRAPATTSANVVLAHEAMGKTLRGFADRETGEIWIANTLSGRDLARTICHEVAHLAGREHPEAEHFADENVAAVAAAALR